MVVEAINELWWAKKIRAVGMKRTKILIEIAEKIVGVKQGVYVARHEISMLIEDFLKQK